MKKLEAGWWGGGGAVLNLHPLIGSCFYDFFFSCAVWSFLGVEWVLFSVRAFSLMREKLLSVGSRSWLGGGTGWLIFFP